MNFEECSNSFLDAYDEIFASWRSEEAYDEQADGGEASDEAVDTFFGFPVHVRLGPAVDLGSWPDDFLSQKITYMVAPKSKWGTKCVWTDKKTGQSRKGWKKDGMTVQDLANAFVNPTISTVKDGPMFMMGELDGSARKADKVTALHAMVFDLDAGQPLDDIIPRLQKFDACYIVYTSFSNGKAEDVIALKALKDFDPGISDNPTDADACRYLSAPRPHGKGYWPAFAESAKITTISGSGESALIEIAHAPMTKCRVIFPLAEGYIVGDDAYRSAKEWKALYVHIANEIGLAYDPACSDVNRAFYSARCPSPDNYQCVIGGTKPLVLPEVTEEMLEAVGASKTAKRDGSGVANQRKDSASVEGVPDIEHFLWEHGEVFDVTGWLSDINWEMRGWGNHQKQAIRCPNDASHSNPGEPNDTGCVALGADYTDCGTAVITCRHAHCQGLSTGDFMHMICEEVLTTTDTPIPVLEDYLFEIIDDAVGNTASDASQTAEASATKSNNNAGPATPNKPKQKFSKTKALLKGTNYKVNNFDWIEYRDDKAEESTPKAVCQAFEVLGQGRTKERSEWSLYVEFNDPDGHAHRVIIPKADIHGDPKGLRKRLASEGFNIAPGGALLEKLILRLDPKERVLLVKKPGWLNDRATFVTPDGEAIGMKDGETIVLENALTGQLSGTLEGQLEAWDIAFRHGSAHHFIGCLAGVAGCLVEYIGLGSTPIVTLSGSSSKGKSTAMMLGASCFGQPEISAGSKQGLMHSLRATPNGLEFKAERSNGTYLGLDETAQGDIASKLEELIFMIASGSGKNRMKADSTERETKGWETFCLISSEHPMVKLVERMGRSARTGFTARCADIDVSNAQPIPEADYLRMMALLKQNYGHIGPAFAAYLIANAAGDATGELKSSPEALRAQIEEKTLALAGNGAPPLIWRSAGVFGILWQVGEILGAAGLLPEGLEEGEGERRIKEIWEAYRSSAEADALSPARKAVQTLRENLIANMGNNVHPRSKEAQTKAKETVAWFEPLSEDVFTDEPTTFYVRVKKLAELAGDAASVNELCKELENEGILDRASEDERAHGYLRGVGEVQHYRLNF